MMRRKKKRNPFSGLRTRSARKTGTIVEPDAKGQYNRRRGQKEVREAADEAAFDVSAIPPLSPKTP